MTLLRTLVHKLLSKGQTVRRLFSDRSSRLVPLGSMTLDPDDVKIAQKWLEIRSGWRDRDVVFQYESEFARWNGSGYALAFMGGRVALSAAIFALQLRPGDEVIVPGYTCVVVPNSFAFAGVRTVYSDIELDTFGLDVRYLEKKVTSRTRAILLHHLYGLVCRDYEAILDFARRHSLSVIEDCAQATGAVLKGIKVGNRGDIGFYSTEQSKVLNTIQGGIAITNNPDLARRLINYREEAKEPDPRRVDKLLHNVMLNYYESKYEWQHPQSWRSARWAVLCHEHKRMVSTTREEMRGIRPSHYGERMPAPIAALGLNQLRKVDQYNQCRRQAAQKWDSWCESNGYRKPSVIDGSKPVYLRYPVLVEPEKKRDDTWATQGLGTQLGVWFLSNLHPVPSNIDGCPNADMAVRQCVNFPTLLP
jgi:dTDP-4-amino-4,6-dideoxygalactose transaminase